MRVAEIPAGHLWDTRGTASSGGCKSGLFRLDWKMDVQ